jgi:hypothetical protein
MHLLERYATSCGVKIGRPYIYDSFFPLTVDRYISFQPFSKYPSKNYDFWQEVIDIIIPYLNKQNIKIVQLGVKDDKPFNSTLYLAGQTNISQAAFIIKNGIMHVGADSFAAHIASGYNKKIVAIYSNNNIENVKPYWSKDEDLVLINPKEGTKKPSYSAGENPKNINKIKPEEIAKGILDLLNINYEKMPKTIYVGEEYFNKTFEVILDQLINPDSIPIANPIIRMDYSFNEQGLEIFLQKKKCIIVTDKPINTELLKHYQSNIPQLMYIIDDNNDSNFVKELKKLGINYVLISYLNDNDLNKYKINYMDYNLIFQKTYNNKKQTNIQDVSNMFYISSKIIVSSQGQFNSKFDWLNKNGRKVVDDPEFWKESNSFYIFSLDQR